MRFKRKCGVPPVCGTACDQMAIDVYAIGPTTVACEHSANLAFTPSQIGPITQALEQGTRIQAFQRGELGSRLQIPHIEVRHALVLPPVGATDSLPSQDSSDGSGGSCWHSHLCSTRTHLPTVCPQAGYLAQVLSQCAKVHTSRRHTMR